MTVSICTLTVAKRRLNLYVQLRHISRLAPLIYMAYRRVVTAEQKIAPCFRGTRAPIQSLIDFLEGGETIDAFLNLYPPIAREQVLAVLDFANSQLLECVSSLTSA
jgi:uncharacterized protein (DUF433 family)